MLFGKIKKPVSIYIREDKFDVPDWQIQEVRHRDATMINNPAYLLDCDTVISGLERELGTTNMKHGTRTV